MDAYGMYYNTYDDLVRKMAESGREFNTDFVEKAYLFANKAHAGQKRKSGEPYIVHPISVACILVELGMDTESVVAALLHDVIEDTDATLPEVTEQFGKPIALLIDGVTKLDKIGYRSREEHQAENLRKMLIAMSEDIRVIIIKLADRLNNMRTLGAQNEQKQRDIARETLYVYAPIAHRLGIRPVKEELEDLSLRYIDPVGYKTITEQLQNQQSDRERFLDLIKREIYERLSVEIPGITVEGRIKSVHGIYRKMYIQQKEFSDIYDIYAVRVIVKTEAECYQALGIVHSMYVLLPNRFKDYINMPKPNGYRSLHTTVMRRREEADEHSTPFEIQIRTEEMHKMAEYGIAAHWKYKIGSAVVDPSDARIEWIRKMLEHQQENGDVTELMNDFKSDLMPEEIYVFTPRGDVKCLPSGSTVVDFAYAIHSQVGHRMIGAKVNGRIVSFSYKLRTGDMVEIRTSKEITSGPSRDWLKIVATGEARNKIRSWIKNECREENIVRGKEELEREFRRNGIRLPEDKELELMAELLRRFRVNTSDDFYAAIGYGGIASDKLVQTVREEYQKLTKPQPQLQDLVTQPQGVKQPKADAIIIEGIDNCQKKISKCCNPLPGDEIIGFITRGYGVSIHRRDCPNVPANISAGNEPQRWVKAYWADNITQDEFKSSLRIVCSDRKNLASDITTQLSNMHINITQLNMRVTKDGLGIITASIVVTGREHLRNVIARLEKIDSVLSIDEER